MNELEYYTAMKKECISAAYNNVGDLANLWLNKKKKGTRESFELKSRDGGYL